MADWSRITFNNFCIFRIFINLSKCYNFLTLCYIMSVSQFLIRCCKTWLIKYNFVAYLYHEDVWNQYQYQYHYQHKHHNKNNDQNNNWNQIMNKNKIVIIVISIIIVKKKKDKNKNKNKNKFREIFKE